MWSLLLSLMLTVAAQTTFPGVDADAVLERVQAHYDSLQGFEARFTQRYERRIVGKVIEEKGTLAVKKPGRMRWAYSSPEEKLFITNGSKSYFYIPEEKQVYVSHSPGGALGMSDDSPFALLAGGSRLADSFRALPSDSPPRVGGTMLRLVPHLPREEFEEVELEVAPGVGEVRRVILLDSLGNRTEFLFEQIRENRRLSEALFRFTIPSGVDVVLASEASGSPPPESPDP